MPIVFWRRTVVKGNVMATIFISYRRDDSREASRRMADRLSRQFGTESVFRDVEAIEAGADFSRKILDGIRGAHVMLVLIGPSWLQARCAQGRFRLEEPEDFVRREIETALRWRVPIVPVLIEGASMPDEAELPPSIRQLALRQAHRLTEDEWHEELDDLADCIAKVYRVEPLPHDTRSYLMGRLQSVRHYPSRLVQLFRRPQRFLATRALGTPRDTVDALIFFIMSTCLAVFLAIVEWPGRSWYLFGCGAAISMIATVLLSGPLYIAWRVAGGASEYGRIMTILSYQSSVLHCGLGLGGLVSMITIRLTRPQLLENLREAIPKIGARVWSSEELQTLISGPVSLYLAMFCLALLTWAGLSWGAYRRALGLSRYRSLIALILTGVLVLFGVSPFMAIAEQ